MFFNYLSLPFQDAYCRGLSGWKRICSDSAGDIIEITNQCIETLDKYLSAELCPITDEDARSDLIALLNDLVEKKRLLESISWVADGLTEREESFYYGDVYFYCGMCAMVRQLSLTIHAFIPASEFPSLNILGYNISLKDADRILNFRYGSIPDRISLILNERNTDAIQEKLKDLNNRLNSTDVHSCLKSASCIMLNNYKPQMVFFKDEEEYLNSILDTLLLKSGGETSSCFNFHFLVDVVQSGLIMSWELYEIGSGFIKATTVDFKDCSAYFQKFILQRIKKIRKDMWPLPKRWKATILQNMEVLYLLSEAEDKKKNKEKSEPKRLIWKDTGQKFAAFVAPAIQKGLIELEGNESQGPLLERLTQYIRIEKVKGSGGLGQESLVTYLKQAIRDE